MSLLDKFRGKNQDNNRDKQDSASNSNGNQENQFLEPNGNVLLRAVQKAASKQTSPITGYVNILRKRNPDKSPAEIQKLIDKHFTRIVTASGTGAGASAAVPGIGTFASLGLSTGDAFFFLEATTWYTLASAVIRGIDITQKEDRTSLVLLAINGSSGNEAVATLLGANGIFGLKSLARPTVGQMNSKLAKMAVKTLRRRLATSVVAKALPLGVGAVLGGKLNHSLSKKAREQVTESLGQAPNNWNDEAKKELAAGDNGTSDASTAVEKAWTKLAEEE